MSSGCTSNVEPIETVEPTVKPTTETVVENIEEVDLAPYYRIAGFALENLDDINDLPIAVWVDFQPSDDTVLKVRVVGEGNPYLAENVQNLLCEYAKETDTFIGKKASELTKQSTTLKEAVTSAAKSYLATKDNPDGGLIVDSGIDMIVSGATRTSNAIIYAVNAAIAEYNKN